MDSVYYVLGYGVFWGVLLVVFVRGIIAFLDGD